MRFVSKGQERSDDYFLMKAVCSEIDARIGARRTLASSLTCTNVLSQTMVEHIARKYQRAGWTVVWNIQHLASGAQRTNFTLTTQ